MRSLYIITIFLFCLLICLMAGCGDRAVPTGEQFAVYIRNDTGADAYAIQLDYTLGGDILGSVAGCYADNSPIKPGASMDFRFLPEDFPVNADLSQFSVQLQTLDRNGNPSSAEFSVSFPAAYGEIYEISLSGSSSRLIP